MTNPPTDERRVTDAMVDAAIKASDVVISRNYAFDYEREAMRAALEAALSRQGDVVKVSDLRALLASWDERADGMESKGLGDAFGSLGNIRTGLVSAYNSASEDLAALISKAEKV